MKNIDASNFKIKDYFKEIKKLLCELGYKNKVINIQIVLDLYQTYGEGMNEETFVKEVLDVRVDTYKKAKKDNGDLLVLKTKDTLDDREIRILREKLIEDGYAMYRVNYQKILELYNNFGNGLRERSFALKVLDLSYDRYFELKEDENKVAIILKNSGNVQKVILQMIEDGYENYIVKSYAEFLAIYKKYGYSFSKVFFSENILKITYDDYRRLKANSEVKILPIKVLDNDIDKIVNTLESLGYKNRIIDYNEFLQLYREYGKYLSEKDFAYKVLRLSSDGYKFMKLKNGRTTVLKEKGLYDVESIKKILVEQKLVNKAIDYEELKRLYLEYGGCLSEKDFALNVLELSLDGYRLLRRCNNTDKVRILKKEIPKEVEKIKKFLLSKGYSNKMISYPELHELYLEYGHFMAERQFAMQVLQISSSNYQNVRYFYKKNKKLSVTILPYKKLSIDELNLIKQELIALGYEDKKMTINEINNLYLKYSHIMKKSVFCEKILGVYDFADYSSDSCVTVLRKNDLLDDLEIEHLKKKIYEQGYYYKKIKLEKLEQLYQEYGDGLTYWTFVNEVLGITSRQINDAKAKNGYVRVIDINIKNTMEIVTNKYLTDIRYYSKEEILNICSEYGISLENFILYSLLKTVEYNQRIYIETYINILNEHNKLWIGNGKVSNDTIVKYYSELENNIMHVIRMVQLIYPNAYQSNQDQNEDFQDLLLFFIENGSEVEYNFMVYNNPDWERYFFGKLKRRMIINALQRIAGSTKEKKRFVNADEDIIEKELKDEKTDIEEFVLSKVQNESIWDERDNDNCILLLGQLLLEGMTINEAKELICNRFSMSELELLNCLKVYLEKCNVQNFDLTILNVGDEWDNSNLIKKRRI